MGLSCQKVNKCDRFNRNVRETREYPRNPGMSNPSVLSIIPESLTILVSFSGFINPGLLAQKGVIEQHRLVTEQHRLVTEQQRLAHPRQEGPAHPRQERTGPPTAGAGCTPTAGAGCPICTREVYMHQGGYICTREGIYWAIYTREVYTGLYALPYTLGRHTSLCTPSLCTPSVVPTAGLAVRK